MTEHEKINTIKILQETHIEDIKNFIQNYARETQESAHQCHEFFENLRA